MKTAIDMASSLSIPIYLIDRDINITLSRLLNEMSLKEKLKLFYEILNAEEIEVSEEDINKMIKNPEKFISLLKDMSPTMFRVLVNERDRYMAKKIFELSKVKNSLVVVVGAGHVKGIINYLEKLKDGYDYDIYELLKVKKKKFKIGKIFSYLLTIAIFGILGYIIFYSINNPDILKLLTINWILLTGGLASLGVILARGKPLTALVAFLSAPITTLIPLPFAAVGTVTGLIELKFREINEEDIINFINTNSLKELLNNNLFRILLVATLSNIGASIGVFYCLGKFINLI